MQLSIISLSTMPAISRILCEHCQISKVVCSQCCYVTTGGWLCCPHLRVAGCVAPTFEWLARMGQYLFNTTIIEFTNEKSSYHTYLITSATCIFDTSMSPGDQIMLEVSKC